MILGTIGSYTSGSGLTVTVDGEDSPTTKQYMFLGSYSPTVGDRVLIEEISGSYVILGKVTNAYTAPSVSHADSATKATVSEYVSNGGWSTEYYRICFKVENNYLYYRYGTQAWKKLANG